MADDTAKGKDKEVVFVAQDSFPSVKPEADRNDPQMSGIEIAPDKIGRTSHVDTHAMDKSIADAANKKYQETVTNIVDIANAYLRNQQNGKKALRRVFCWFFIILLSVQLVSVIVFMIFAMVWEVSETLLLTYITSVFVETLSAIVIMIKFAFESKDEVEIIKLLTAIVHNYQFLGQDKTKK